MCGVHDKHVWDRVKDEAKIKKKGAMKTDPCDHVRCAIVAWVGPSDRFAIFF